MFTDSKAFMKWQEQVKREGFNLIIQGGGADVLKLAMINIAEKNPWGDKFRMLLQIHDELMAEVHNSIKEEARRFIEIEMINAEQPFLGEIPAVVEARITERWEK
jgi:DNA polymerase-1